MTWPNLPSYESTLAATTSRRRSIALRERLSPRGDVVSEAGRRRTIEVFGEPLSPQQVVERICGDVRERGLAAVLDYSRAARQGRADGRDASRLGRRAGGGPCGGRSGSFWRRSAGFATTSCEFQRAILHRDVQVERPHGGVSAAALSAAGARRHLRAGRRGGVSFDGADDGRAGAGGGRGGDCGRRAADEVRRVQPRSAGHLPRAGHHARSIASAARRPWRRWPTASRACRRSIRSSAPATCSSRWPSSTSMAKSISIRSPARAKWS